jgi:hypothetical protein
MQPRLSRRPVLTVDECKILLIKLNIRMLAYSYYSFAFPDNILNRILGVLIIGY